MTFAHCAKTLMATALLATITAPASALDIRKPARAIPRADLVVYLVDQDYGQQHLMRVTIRNNGNAKSDSAILLATDIAAPGSKAEGSIPSIEPNSVRNIDLKFSRRPKQGDRIRIVADAKNHVQESNERNNVKVINY